MSSKRSRWFPGQELRQRLEYGWVLTDGEQWDGTADGGSDLTSFHLAASRTLSLEFRLRLEAPTFRVVQFDRLSELKVEGDLQWEGETDMGWEVLDTNMLVAARPREDGRVVYLLQLPDAIVCFASAPGVPQDIQ